jgi:hypothetical protein
MQIYFCDMQYLLYTALSNNEYSLKLCKNLAGIIL